jgi:methylenetetrahydrofolate dehydrogenase (NADP+)/methenyltetrahydrofolate cyclohydrolase
MPLPSHLNSFEAIKRITPEKDVDGFHPWNVGLLNIGEKNGLIPCTPQACVYVLKTVVKDLTSKNVLIIGRSNIVGWPLAKLLINENCVITTTHSFASDLKSLCLQNEIIISATGKASLIKKDMVKKEHIIIDVGINRIKSKESQEMKLVGDVDFDSALPLVSAITPVPGGVGPMTIAFLMRNVFKAFCFQNGINL